MIELRHREVDVQAQVGDRLIISGHAVGDPDRDGEILEVRGPGGTPPFVVRWEDTGHETLYFPGSDATVQHFGEPAAATPSAGPVADAVRDVDRRLLADVQLLLDAADALDGAELLPDALHEAYAFVGEELLPHLVAESTELYPVIDELLGAPGATGPMLRQLTEIQRLVARLGRLRTEAASGVTDPARRNLRQVLHALHALLSVHLAIEEELYVPLLEARLPPRRSAALTDALEAAEAAPPTSLTTT